METHEILVVGAGPAGLKAAELLGKAGKDVIVVKEAPAFVVNRILCLMLNEAFYVLG